MEKVILIAKLLPALIELIKAIEAAIPGQGQGKQKLSAVRGVLETTVDGFESLWPSLEKVITVLVTTLNSVGAFK